MAGNSIPDFPAASIVDAQLPFYQTTGGGTPASTTYQGTIKARAVSALLAVPKAVQTAGTIPLAISDRYVPCNSTGGAIIFNPPASPLDGHELIIEDVTGAATPTNYIQFNATVGPLSGPKITTPYGILNLRYDAAQAKWYGALPAGSTAQATPSAPTAPNSISVFTMAGLAGSFTPSKSGTALIVISGTIIDASSLTAGVGIAWQISYGTGAAPGSNSTLAGTQTGAAQQYKAATVPAAAVDVMQPFSAQAVVTGLTPGTTYWIDLAQKALVTASQYSFSNISISVIEL